MRRLVLSISLICWGTPALAADWIFIDSNRAKTSFYLDFASVRKEGNYTAAWERRDSSKDSSVKWRESKVLKFYDCAKRKSAIKQWVTYDAQGGVDASETNSDYELEWDEVIPETVAESLLNAVCKISP